MEYPKGNHVIYIYWSDINKDFYIGKSGNMKSRNQSHKKRFGQYNHKIIKDNLFECDVDLYEAEYINYPPSFVEGYKRLNIKIPDYNPPQFKPTREDYLNSLPPHTLEDYLNSLPPPTLEEEFNTKYLEPYLNQIKYFNENPTIKTRIYKCICGDTINVASASCICKEKHETYYKHTTFVEKYGSLLNGIQSIPISSEQAFITEYYLKKISEGVGGDPL
jgi:hypothetical protein